MTVPHVAVSGDRDQARASADRTYWIGFTAFAALCIVWLVLATWTLKWPVIPSVGDAHMGADPHQHALDLMLSVSTLGLGLSLIWLAPDRRTARWFAVGLVGTSVGFSLTAHHLLDGFSRRGMELGAPTPLSGVHLAFHIVTGVAYTGGLLLFPDGRWPRVSAAATCVSSALLTALAAVVYYGHQPVWFIWYCGTAMVVAGFGFQFYKARYSPTPADKRLSSTFATLFLFALMFAAGCVVVEWLTPLGDWLGLENLGDSDRSLTVALTVLSPFLASTTMVVWFGIILYPKLAVRSVQFHRRRYILGALTGVLLTCYVLIEYGVHQLLDDAHLPEGWISLALFMIGVIGLATERGRERLADGFKRLILGSDEDPRQLFRDLMDVATISTAPGVVSALATMVAETLQVTSGRLTVELPGEAQAVYAWPNETADPPERVVLGSPSGAGVLQLGRDHAAQPLDRQELRLAGDLGTEAVHAIRRLQHGGSHPPHVVVVNASATTDRPTPPATSSGQEGVRP